MKFNVYDALAAMYDFKVNGLSLRAMKDDLADADKIQRDIDEYSRLADDCRVKARNVKPITGTNDNPTLAQVERRAQSIDLTIRQFSEDFVLVDKVDFNVLPLNFSTLDDLAAFLDLSGVGNQRSDCRATRRRRTAILSKKISRLP